MCSESVPTSDGFESTEAAPSHADVETIARGLGVKLVLLHVGPCHPVQDGGLQSYPDEIDKKYLEGLAEQLKHRGVEAWVEVLCSDVPNKLAEYCADHKEELTVMFTHDGDIGIIV